MDVFERNLKYCTAGPFYSHWRYMNLERGNPEPISWEHTTLAHIERKHILVVWCRGVAY